ncbi:hypothetical protein [Antarcticirhabdus aurantiaca]|uniref:Uncharacterized protein n=1 Tax=Antarcticirhabdus aurantiaca TaxID=2606717 RepID=A0ACD4NLY2_9HYPH|nr:hypothetical protein [Antarcticirhabdus aurantiaca]WAJ27836.1 hypothetical protein OXU80_23815 [Jeongeuplla avenae]
MAAGGAEAADTERRSLAELAQAGFAWWLGELADMVPARLKARAGFARPAAFDCVLLPDGRALAHRAERGRDLADPAGEAFAASLAALAEQAGRDRSVRLSVPASLCLLRHVAIPARALPHAGALLRHEIEALLPDPPEDILCDWYVETEDRAKRQLILRQVVLLRPRIAAVETALARAGLVLSRITVGEAERRPVPVDLLAGRPFGVAACLAGLPLAAKLMHGLGVLLLVAALFIASGRQAETLEAMAETRASYPRPSPAALSASAAADFLDETARAPGATRLLDVVATRLPAGAFVSAVSLSDGILSVSVAGPGRGNAAAALRAEPLFAAVEPVGSGDGAVLALSVTLAPPGAPATNGAEDAR